VAYGNIRIVESVTASHMRGHVVYVDNETKFAEGNEITVELWQTGRECEEQIWRVKDIMCM
jgi:hypothetical protein